MKHNHYSRLIYLCICIVFVNTKNVIAFSGVDNLMPEAVGSSEYNSDDESSKRTFTPELLFGNEKIRQGKVQSGNQGYFQPSFSYHAKTGFNSRINSNYYLDQKVFDEFVMMAGYDFKLFNYLNSGSEITKYFYTDNSPQSGASVSGNFNFYTKHNFSLLESELDFNVDLLKVKSKKKRGNSNVDYSIAWENYHSFDFNGLIFAKDQLSIVPQITVSAGTQNVYILYFQRAQKKFQNVDFSTEIASASKFKITSIEFDLPADYYIDNFKIEPCIHYFIPENQPALLSISKTFYFTLDLAYEF